MQKIKWSLMTAAVVLGVGGALATRPLYDCTSETQYYLSGGSYYPAGVLGVDYECAAGEGTCTYTTPNGVKFIPCQPGVYCTSGCILQANKGSDKSTR